MKFKISTIAFLTVSSMALAAADSLNVAITALMKHPQKFNNKRVTFSGYYNSGDGHGTSIFSEQSDTSPRIFLNFKNALVPLKPLERLPSGTYVCVTGTFHYREMKVTRGKNGNTIVAGFGWMNDYDKELASISEFTRIASPRR